MTRFQRSGFIVLVVAVLFSFTPKQNDAAQSRCQPDEALRPDLSMFEDDPAPLRCNNVTFISDTLRRDTFEDLGVDPAVQFSHAHFDGPARFLGVRFELKAIFEKAVFTDSADFRGNVFFSEPAHFDETTFQGPVDFTFAHFLDDLDFRKATFELKKTLPQRPTIPAVTFRGAVFCAQANFSDATFTNGADFQSSWFAQVPNFTGTTFGGPLELGVATKKSDKGCVPPDTTGKPSDRIDESATRDTTVSPLDALDQYDFRLARFLPNAKIILHSPAKLNIQLEHLQEHLRVYSRLDYFKKKAIYDTLIAGYRNDELARFELSYMFKRSVRRQKKMTQFELYEIHDWKWWKDNVYFLSMGFGYRPFQIFYLALAVSLLFAATYWLFIPMPVSAYLKGKDMAWRGARNLQSPWVKGRGLRRPIVRPYRGSVLHCIYFSVLVLVTLRLPRDIVTRFGRGSRWAIAMEWGVGVFIYYCLIRYAEPGAIPNALKSFFIL